MAKNEIISYAEVAEMMGISVQGVWKAMKTDPGFPSPVTPASLRSPGFSRSAIKKYIQQRGSRSAGKRGRPPAVSVDRVRLPQEVNERIGRLIREAGTFAEFVALAGISDNALRQRLSGKTRWHKEELKAFARRLRVSVDELTAVE